MGLALSIPSSPDRGSWLPPLSAEKGDTGWRRNTAEIVTLAKAKLPVVPDYFDVACRRVDEATRQPDLLIPVTRTAPVQQGLGL